MSELEPFSSNVTRLVPPKVGPPVGPQTATIRVLIADGQPLVRDRIRKALETEADFTITGDVGDGVDAVRQTVESSPHVLLLDPSISELSGLEVLRALRQADVEVRTILLATELETPVMVEMVQAGARGFVSRAVSSEVLSKSIRKVNSGELWIGRKMLTDLVHALAAVVRGIEIPAPRDFGLTRREREIVALAVRGETNRAIARRLSVGQDTIKHHLTNIFHKTGVSSRLELALLAMHDRLVGAGKK
jgi:two-component system nitrate/nitrite response regulator NarL